MTFDKEFLQTGSTHGNTKIIEKLYESNDGIDFVGNVPRNAYSLDWNIALSDGHKWYKTIDLSEYNTLSFYAKAIALHGGIYISIDQKNLYDVDYKVLPNSWTKYEVDLSEYIGNHILTIMGGYYDASGYSNSESQIADIMLTK